MIILLNLIPNLTLFIARYFFLSIIALLTFTDISLSEFKFDPGSISAKVQYIGQNLGRAELDFNNSRFNFMRANIVVDFTQKFPVIRYFSPHFSIKIVPDSLFSGISTCRSDNLLFGKAKFSYSFKGNYLHIKKMDSDIYLKPSGFKIDKKQKFACIFDFRNMTFKIDQDDMKGFTFLDKKQKVIGELNLFFDWVKGKVRFRLGNLLKVNFDLKEVDFIKLSKKTNLNAHDFFSGRSSTKYCSFDLNARIDKIIFPNEEMKDVKISVFCMESNIRSLLFTAKLDENNLFIAMNREKQIWIKGDSMTKLAKLFIKEDEFKNGELGMIVTLLNSNFHTPSFSYNGEISNLQIKKIWLLEVRNLFSPIRIIRCIFDSPSKTDCKLNGFLDQEKFFNQIDINNSYNTISTNSIINFEKQALDMKISLIYKNLFTYASEKFLLNNLADKIEASIYVDLSNLDANDIKMKLKKISITPGVVLSALLQSVIF